jgi:NADH-quinone oxidoreductase subunit N
MKALIIVSLLGVVAMMAEVLRFKKILLPMVVLGLLGALATLTGEWNTGIRHFNDMVYFDNYALGFSSLLIVITLLWLFMGFPYFKQGESRGEHAALILFVLSGAICMVSFSDLTMFFIGLEILSVSLYVLAASNKLELRSNEAGLKYFLMGAFATGFLLFGIALVYGATGSFNLVEIRDQLTSQSAHPMFLQAGVLLIMVGLLFKVSAAPFHFWAPDVYEGAPTLVTAFMATVVKTAAFAAFYRLFSTCFSSMTGSWLTIMTIVSGLTMLTGNVLAVYQTSLKRMLAYSSIAHAGYMLMAIVSLNENSMGAVFFYSTAYSIASLGVFSVLNALSQKTGNESIASIAGLGKKDPFAAVLLILVMLSLSGIPPLSGFIAKYYVFLGAMKAGFTVLVLTAILASLVGVFYYFRVIYAVCTEKTEGDTGNVVVGGYNFYLLLLAGVFSLILGLLPDWILSLM